MSTLVTYAADHGADAIGLACSVYAPAVEIIKDLVDVPLVSSYGPVMADAVASGPRVGIIASVPATIRDAEHYLREEAKLQNREIEPHPRLAEDLIDVLRHQGDAAFEKRLAEEVNSLAPRADAVLLSQFSMANARCRCFRRPTAAPAASRNFYRRGEPRAIIGFEHAQWFARFPMSLAPGALGRGNPPNPLLCRGGFFYDSILSKMAVVQPI